MFSSGVFSYDEKGILARATFASHFFDQGALGPRLQRTEKPFRVSRQSSSAEGECVRRNQILPRIRGDHHHVALPAVGWLCVRSAAEPSVLTRSWNTPTSAHRDRNLPLLRLDQSSGSSPLPKQHHHHSRSRHPDARVMALNVAAAISSHRKHRRLGRA